MGIQACYAAYQCQRMAGAWSEHTILLPLKDEPSCMVVQMVVCSLEAFTGGDMEVAIIALVIVYYVVNHRG